METKRITSIDLMRGIVMIIMVLDHVRDLFHVTSLTEQPTDLLTTTPALFFTRWITHLCAPVFVFLSGVSAYLSLTRTNDLQTTRVYLLKRGVILILLDLTVVNFGVWFDIHFNVFLFNVISAIGFGFIVLALLINLSARTIGFIGLFIIFFHNLAPLVPGAEDALFKRILMPFFAPGAFPLGGEKLFVVGYPPLVWLGLVLAGFAAGTFFMKEPVVRKKLFLRIGLGAVLLFVALRFLNVYGDSFAWEKQSSAFYTFLSFINLTKYPPSLDFCLLFLGIMFLLFSVFENRRNKLTDVVSVYGKVPLFYFIAHWYIIHPVLLVLILFQGFHVSDLTFGFNFGRPAGYVGLQLWAVYLVWILVVLVFYPLCKWYWGYKQSHPEIKFLKYL